MTYVNPEALVSTQWLAEHRGASGVKVLDASWHLASAQRNPRAEYEAQHIRGAAFFDIDRIADRASTLPHMLPSAEQFAARVAELGVGSDDRVVVYDTCGYSAPRAWWMFRAFGHTKVAVLDGGVRRWIADGHPVTNEPTEPGRGAFAAQLDTTLVRDYAQVLANMKNPREQLVDARSAGRFAGSEPEPRAGLPSGHIPGSLSVPFTRLLSSEDTFLGASELRSAFADAGIDLTRPIATTCGSGITACILALALYLLGEPAVPVYDGSWTDWATRPDARIERA